MSYTLSSTEVSYLSWGKYFWREPYVALTTIDSSTNIKTTSNFPLCYTMCALGDSMKQVKISFRCTITGRLSRKWKVNSTKIVKKSCNNWRGHGSRWPKSSFGYFRFTCFSSHCSISNFWVKCNWREWRQWKQYLRSKRETTCFNLNKWRKPTN